MARVASAPGATAATAPPRAGASVEPPAAVAAPPRLIGCSLSDKMYAWRDDGRVYAGEFGSAFGFVYPDDASAAVVRTESTLAGVVQVVRSWGTTCARTRGGEVFCSGSILATGATPASANPAELTRVGGIANVAQLVYGGTLGFCGRLQDGSVRCWSGSANPATPAVVAGFTDVTQLAMSDGTVCGLSRGGGVACAGRGVWVESDEGSLASARPVAGLANIVEIALSRAQGCARRTDGAVLCWGAHFGATPVVIDGVAGATAIACGANNRQVDGGTEGSAAVYDQAGTMCAWTAGHHAVCWSSFDAYVNEGGAASGPAASFTPPHRVPELDAVHGFGFGDSTGDVAACALTREGDLKVLTFANDGALTVRPVRLGE